MLGIISRVRLLTQKFIALLALLVRLIPPLKKGGTGGFFRLDWRQIPLDTPFPKGEVARNYLSVFLRRDIRLAVTALGLFFSVSSAGAQTKKPLSLAELAAYTGADREQHLIAGAKAEGKVTWYTSLAGSSYKDLASGFEKKYGIKIEPYRGASSDIMTKVTAEAQAKQIIADVIETTLPTLRYLRESKLLIPFTSVHLAKYPAHAKENAIKGLVYWGIDRETYMGVGYNTNLIPASAVPKKVRRSSEAGVERQDRFRVQRDRHAHAGRDPQGQRRRVCQEVARARDLFTQYLRPGDGGYGDVG